MARASRQRQGGQGVHARLTYLPDHVVFPMTHSGYAFSSYNEFREAFFTELNIKKQLDRLPPADPYNLNNMEIKPMFEEQDVRQMIADLIKTGMVDGQTLSEGHENYAALKAKYDTAADEAASVLEGIAIWARKAQRSGITHIPSDALKDLEKAILLLGTRNPIEIRQKIASNLGKMMEVLYIQSFNTPSFREHMTNQGVKNAFMKINQAGAGGIRDAIEVDLETGGKLAKTQATSPLIDITLTGEKTKGGADAEVSIGFTVKTPTAPTETAIKAMTTSWTTLLISSMQDLAPRTGWGLVRIFDFRSNIPNEISRYMVHYNMMNIIAGGGHDEAQYMLYKSKIYHLGAILKVILEAKNPFDRGFVSYSPEPFGAGNKIDGKSPSLDMAVRTYSRATSISWKAGKSPPRGKNAKVGKTPSLIINWHLSNVLAAVPR